MPQMRDRHELLEAGSTDEVRPALEIQYVRSGRYALYIDGELYQEYPNFDEAADAYEEIVLWD